MSILLGHSSIRPLTNILQKINMACEKERLGFALLSKKGFFRAADTMFLSVVDKKLVSLGTLPVGQVEKIFRERSTPEHSSIITEWIRGDNRNTGGFWHGTLPFSRGKMELFRATLTNADDEAVLFFKEFDERSSSFSHHTISGIFMELSDEITSILLDALDHESMMEGLSDEFWEKTPLSDPPQIFLWNTPRWQKESFLIQVSLRSSIHPGPSITAALSSTLPKKILRAIASPGARSIFLREAGVDEIHMVIPLYRETSYFGWITQKLSIEMKKNQTFPQRLQQKGDGLSRNFFRNREELRLICVLNRDSDSGLPTRRGLIDGLTDLLEIGSFRNQGVGLLGISLSDPNGITPMTELLGSFTRHSDLLGKVSPMEFLIVLPNTTRSGTEKAATRLQSTLAMGTQRIRLTSRLSFSHAPEDGASPLRLLRGAFMENARMIDSSRGQNPFQ